MLKRVIFAATQLQFNHRPKFGTFPNELDYRNFDFRKEK